MQRSVKTTIWPTLWVYSCRRLTSSETTSRIFTKGESFGQKRYMYIRTMYMCLYMYVCIHVQCTHVFQGFAHIGQGLVSFNHQLQPTLTFIYFSSILTTTRNRQKCYTEFSFMSNCTVVFNFKLMSTCTCIYAAW